MDIGIGAGKTLQGDQVTDLPAGTLVVAVAALRLWCQPTRRSLLEYGSLLPNQLGLVIAGKEDTGATGNDEDVLHWSLIVSPIGVGWALTRALKVVS